MSCLGAARLDAALDVRQLHYVARKQHVALFTCAFEVRVFGQVPYFVGTKAVLLADASQMLALANDMPRRHWLYLVGGQLGIREPVFYHLVESSTTWVAGLCQTDACFNVRTLAVKKKAEPGYGP